MTLSGRARRTARRLGRLLLEVRMTELSSTELAADAWVVAPHEDDETLGCGGTIIKKTRAGARVRVVFVSNGAASHASVPREQLAQTRQAEALAATGRLGVAPEDVHFLGLDDGLLAAKVDDGARAFGALLGAHPAPQIFIPYELEPPADHRATRTVALSAVARAGCPVAVYEYPVWFWDHWPWMRTTTPERPRDVARKARRDARRLRRLFRDFRVGVRVEDVLELKRHALGEHRSQVERSAGDPEWPILGDVSDGDFLSCSLQGVELFRRAPGEPSARTAGMT